MLRACLLFMTLFAASAAWAQEVPAANAELGQKDAYCLDLYDALRSCVDVEQEEQACADLKSSDDLPFNNLQAQLEHWPKGYSDQKIWFAYCRQACKSKNWPVAEEFARHVCKVQLKAH